MDSIGVFTIKLNDTASTKARVLQRNYVASLLQRYNLDASVVAFYSGKENIWRISFVKKEIEFTDKGIKQNVSPARRYSYLVGENESTHTAQEFLFQLLKNNDKKYTIKEIEEKFDVEKVTKKFFEEYKEKYLKLKEFLDNNQDFQTEAKNCDFDSEEFAKKLMGQIVFLYFLQKKGWLGVQLIPDQLSPEEYKKLLANNDNVSQNLIKQFYELKDNKYLIESTKFRLSEMEEDIINLTNVFRNTKYNMPWGSGDKTFIRSIFKQSRIEHKNFFDNYLEPFFYRGLNEHRDNQYFALFNCKIPFLNGGLFEPLNDYRWSSAHFNINNDLFSNDKKDGILDFLDLYNFTIDEEEPLEKDIAVDPEMLGKIFENLLDINDRKSKGAFYTPREIVYYMCQESLANYLVNKVGVNYDEIIKFIKYGDLISQYDIEISDSGSKDFEIGKTVFDNIIKLDDALINVKVADPAVGSGAFPLGMVTEIVKLRSNFQNYIIIQNDLKLLNIDDYYNTKHLVSEPYQLKKDTIENCIYAVDIEPSAVDITKLRLWLSLIVDYPNTEEPQPLPNLDCKIMQGNSLIDEFEGVPLFDERMLNNNLKNYHRNESKLKNIQSINVQYSIFNSETLSKNLDLLFNLQQQYFIVSDNAIKKQLKSQIEDIQMASVECSLQESTEKLRKFKDVSKKKQKPWFIWVLEFYDVFKNNGGFDIVIGNPPYGLINKKQNQQKTIEMTEEELSSIKNNSIYYPAKGGLLNIFRLFVCKGDNILNCKGTMCMIFPMAFMCDLSSSNLRKKILNDERIIFIESFPERDDENKRVFKSAKMSVCILCSDKKNIKNSDFYIRTHHDRYVDEKNEKVIINKQIINNIDSDNYTMPLVSSKELEIMNKIINKSMKMKTYSKCYEGEVNITFQKNCIYNISAGYDKLIRGAQIQRYMVTDTVSQGEILYVDSTKYLKNNISEKSMHHKKRRIVMQGITGVNEKHRLKMEIIENDEFCANSANYIIENNEIKLEYILGILNSKLMNWYYKKLSTNSNVNGYEIDNLPLKYKNVSELATIVSEYRSIINNSGKYNENLEQKINNMVFDIYDLSREEIIFIDQEL